MQSVGEIIANKSRPCPCELYILLRERDNKKTTDTIIRLVLCRMCWSDAIRGILLEEVLPEMEGLVKSFQRSWYLNKNFKEGDYSVF